MTNKYVVSLSRAKDDPDRATVAFTLANAALGSGQDTVVFLSSEGVHLSVRNYADDISEPGFTPLAELMAKFTAAGGEIYTCLPCFNKRELDENAVIDGVKIVGGASLVAFMAEGAPSVSY